VETAGSRGATAWSGGVSSSTTNALEGFCSTFKRHQRQLPGTKSTANSLVQNLDEVYLLAFAARDEIATTIDEADLSADAFDAARGELRAREQPAQRRRAAVRSFKLRVHALREDTRARGSGP